MVDDIVKWDPKIPISQADLTKLVKHDAPQSKLPYCNLLGELLWATHTRVDVVHVVRRLYSYSNPYADYTHMLG